MFDKNSTGTQPARPRRLREARERVLSALHASGYEVPLSRITVNLSPADLPKAGSAYDLPIAIGILAASSQIPREILNQHEFVGELALTGELRPIRGALPMTLSALFLQFFSLF